MTHSIDIGMLVLVLQCISVEAEET